MDEAILMQAQQTLEELYKQVLNKVFCHSLAHFNKAIEFPIPNKAHYTVANRVLALKDATVVRTSFAQL